eukprot:gnl/TRDRNA2_/TRDRNA2_173202_c0_seq9.p1 gnl/TRDRNA2_/TRDRNA2_173202_c0~~gnl/TRDRNA2_/TRDRNA2_173202_c0_seq9.p1  ORF type:complete len:153 (+),score=8.11 gnl/TRDRNA2_/TRDRNA2_173202_c0_seq9:311-769(+)
MCHVRHVPPIASKMPKLSGHIQDPRPWAEIHHMSDIFAHTKVDEQCVRQASPIAQTSSQALGKDVLSHVRHISPASTWTNNVSGMCRLSLGNATAVRAQTKSQALGNDASHVRHVSSTPGQTNLSSMCRLSLGTARALRKELPHIETYARII